TKMEGMRVFCLAALIATVAMTSGGLLGSAASEASPGGCTDQRVAAQVTTTEVLPTSAAVTPPVQTTRPPISVVPTRPPATSAAPQSEPSTTAAETGTSSDYSWSPWIIGAVIVAAAVIGIVALVRRPRGSGQWPNQTVAVLDESDQITTHLVGLE